MEVLVLGGFEDLQTGIYICRSFYDLGHGVEAIDTRKFFSELGATNSQTRIKEEIEFWKSVAKDRMMKDEMGIDEKFKRIENETRAIIKGIE